MRTNLPRRRLAATSVAIGVAMLALGFLSSPADAHDGAEDFAGNQSCADFGYTHELKTDTITGDSDWTESNSEIIIPDGEEVPDGLTIKLTNVDLGGDDATFDWAAFVADGDDAGDAPDPFPIDAVLVKSGNGGHKYTYAAPGAFSDTDLVSPNDSISHISFCWNNDVTTTTEEETTTTEEETTTTTEEETTTTEEEEVLGNVVTPQKPAVEAAQLPRTGANDELLMLIGAGFVLIGGGLMLVRRDLVSGS